MKTDLAEKTMAFGHFINCDAKYKGKYFKIAGVNVIDNTAYGHEKEEYQIADTLLILKDLNEVTKKEALVCAELAGLPSRLTANWEVQTSRWGCPIFSFPGDDVFYNNEIVFSEDQLSWRQIDYLRLCGYKIGVDEDWCVKKRINGV